MEVKSKTLNSLRQTRSIYLHALRAFYMCKQFDLDCDFLNNFYVYIARQGLSLIYNPYFFQSYRSILCYMIHTLMTIMNE